MNALVETIVTTDPAKRNRPFRALCEALEPQALLAAFNVKTGRVLGRVVPHRTADALGSFMNALARVPNWATQLGQSTAHICM